MSFSSKIISTCSSPIEMLKIYLIPILGILKAYHMEHVVFLNHLQFQMLRSLGKIEISRDKRSVVFTIKSIPKHRGHIENTSIIPSVKQLALCLGFNHKTPVNHFFSFQISYNIRLCLGKENTQQTMACSRFEVIF